MQKDHKPTNKYVAVLKAFLEYLGRPKTVFDLKDRLKALVFFTVVILLLQGLVKWLLY